MKATTIAACLVTLLGAANAGTIVRWYGCSGEYQQTVTEGDGDCTNISGWKNTNLCSIWVPPEGKDHCEFYTTRCGIPWGTTYSCDVSKDKCNARPWKAIASYKYWARK